ncbi:glycosyltransferase [Segniliparus rugosus]|uniref:Erythromycin biosynthesis protein CIII-like C-terminal domain-containing protein n=1 Tax=Segniliparus rugosus (strain ATCC BAA-974 / DSM 45345 / CCUG 50838 / CIP 108380 / JCM 13579 / CDC 945) TaxID=679197 RepID=E5XV05_SEGRC|nr:nucleotide disphospho-sugar-binding domain-containing protein [Segniliparus rugosus]EFV11841.1 hypothetical protein HMPREF9336_03327 [Segniliparus rugosus ATCC BAA-974]
MRFVVPLTGSRGDAQPVFAICRELRARGHDVVLVVAPEWLEMAEKLELSAKEMYPDIAVELSSPEAKEALASGNALRILLTNIKLLRNTVGSALERVTELAESPELASADAIVTTSLTEEIGQAIAEAKGIPLVALHPYPNRVNSKFPSMFASKMRLPGWGNKLSWVLFNLFRHIAFNLLFVTKLRRRLGLKPAWFATIAQRVRRLGAVEVQIYEPELVPGIVEEWHGKPRPFTGYPKFDESARVALGEWGGPVDEVVSWIGEGEATFFFGFGSTPMPTHTNASVVEAVSQVCQRLGVRALVNFGHGDLPEVPTGLEASVRVVGPIAHDRVFPYCAGAVIGGGVGTTTEALWAGLPTLICGVSYDQPAWGVQVQKMGVGTAMRSVDITADSLTEAIQVLRDPEVVRKAAEVGAVLRQKEASTARAAAAIEDAVLQAKAR